MKVIKENGQIKVQSEYNRKWIDKAHELNGKWDKPYWCFSEDKEPFVRDALIDVYGENGRPMEKVTVDIALDDYEFDQEVIVDNIVIAKRYTRDRSVKVLNGAFVVRGKFEPSGGSSKNPKVTAEAGTVIRVDIPKTVFDRVKDLAGVMLVEKSNDSKRKALENEKDELIKRLAEIEKELKMLA